MHVKTRPVIPVIHTEAYSLTVPGLLDMLTGNTVMRSKPYYEDLVGCHVSSVQHYHSDKHEFVVVKYVFAADGETDERYARFERFRMEEWHLTQSSNLGSVDQLLSSMFDGEGHRLDNVKISDLLSRKDTSAANILGTAPRKYVLVQSLTDIRPGSLSILDVVVFADALGLFAREYSTMTHMCIWYACALFVLIRRRLGDNNARWVKSETQFDKAGTTKIEVVSKLMRTRRRLVDPVTAMLLHQDDQKLERGLLNLCTSLYERGKLNSKQYEKGLAQVKRDVELMRNKPDAIEAVDGRIDAMLMQAHREVHANSEAMQRKETAEANLQTAEVNLQTAEVNLQTAEANLGISEAGRKEEQAKRTAAEHALEDKERENAELRAALQALQRERST